jgi:hypothetical protein
MTRRGRPRKNLPFKQAREIVRSENIGSVKQYEKWYNLNKPAGLPKRPDRAYKNEFVSWNDFLGNDTPFPCVRRSYRPFNAARAFAQSKRFEKKQDWLDFASGDGLPEDIPKRPDLFYRKMNEWISWPNFLGTNVREKTRNLMEADFMFFVIRNPRAERDYYRCGITGGGISSINDYLSKMQGNIVAAYNVPDTFQPNIFLGSIGIEEHNEYKGYYHIPNLYALISKLSIEFNRVSLNNN